jgi:hypothetical protein
MPDAFYLASLGEVPEVRAGQGQLPKLFGAHKPLLLHNGANAFDLFVHICNAIKTFILVYICKGFDSALVTANDFYRGGGGSIYKTTVYAW